MNAEQIWREALEMCGLWKAGERCGRDFLAHKTESELPTARRLLMIRDWTCDCGWQHRSTSDVLEHDIPAPPLGDPAACKAMLDWTSEEIDVPTVDEDTGEKYMWPEHRHRLELWFGDDLLWHARLWGYQDTERNPIWYLALAQAVVALKENRNG